MSCALSEPATLRGPARLGVRVAPTAALVLFAVLILASCSSSTGADNETGNAVSTFSKSYGGPAHDEAHVLLSTDDGGYMMFGSANAHRADRFTPSLVDLSSATGVPQGGNFWLQRLDANGNVEYSRTVGEAPAQTGVVDWQRVRALTDGGYVLVGTAESDTADVAVTRFDAARNVLWRVTYDSGAWLNYSYLNPRGPNGAAANDRAEDIVPTADGGFLIIASSRADLEDRLGIGFPCDPDVPAQEVLECERDQSGNRFIGALSMVVFRLNADGSLRWTRRFTDSAFDRDSIQYAFYGVRALVRGTSDDGVVFAHFVGNGYVTIRRLLADGAPLWRRTVRPSADLWRPIDLIQTDDAVDGPNANRYDGMPDDGFALALTIKDFPARSGGPEDYVVKLDAAGAVLWQSALESGDLEDTDVVVEDLMQHCDYGREPVCNLIAVGAAAEAAFASLIDADGDVQATVLALDGAGESYSRQFKRVVNSNGRIHVLGYTSTSGLSDLIMAELSVTAVSITVATYDRGFEVPPNSVADLRPNGGAVYLARTARPRGTALPGKQFLQFVNSTGRLEAQLNLGDELVGESLRVAVQIARGSYVMAGPQSSADGSAGLLVVRYDLSGTTGRIVWQRVFYAEDLDADVLAAAPTADGGVLLGTYARSRRDDSYPLSATAGRLLKLNANGVRQWERGISGVPEDLQPMPDGSFAMRVFRDRDELPDSFDAFDTAVARVSASGEMLWSRYVSLGPEQGRATAAMTVLADGSLLLAGTRGSNEINFVRLSGGGELLGSSRLTLDANRVALPPNGISSEIVRLTDMQLAQAPDSGFVLAMTERGVTRRVIDVDFTEPYGQSNVLVMKVAADLKPVWTRIYGAAFDEQARDLLVSSDGVISIAGMSASLGERSEAWLLKLSPQGLISEAGCQALLASYPVSGMSSGPMTAELQFVSSFHYTGLQEEALFHPVEDSTRIERGTAVMVTARQCLGDANAGVTNPAPTVRRRLSVVQVGTRTGVVTSVPSGISCGTQLNACAADFAQGSRVTLRADVATVRWRSACDEGSGGSSLECVVLLTADRTIEVDFGPFAAPPPAPQTFVLSFAVQGPGNVRTAEGINCAEAGTAMACSREYPSGSVVTVTAAPEAGGSFLGWSGDTPNSICLSFGRRTEVQLTISANLRCYAQFAPAPPPPPAGSTLSVTIVNGAPGRTVESQPGGILCTVDPGSDCQELFSAGAPILLRAAPQGFQSWQGCDEIVDVNFCRVTMNQSRTVIATFVP